MPEQSRKSNQITGIVLQVLVSHRVPQQMRMQLEAADGAVLVAHRPKPTIRQWSSFANKDPTRWNGWSLGKISGDGLARSDGQRADPLLVPLPISEYNRAASLTNDKIVEIQVNKIANPTARVKYHGKDRIGPKIVSEFDLPKELPHL